MHHFVVKFSKFSSPQAARENGKMDEKLKSGNMQKSIFHYFRMHHFVVKFSKFSSLQATPPNQNPADVFESHRSLPFLLQNRLTPGIPRTAN